MSSALGIVIFALAAIIGYGARTPGGRTQLLAPFVLGSLGLAAAILSVGLLFQWGIFTSDTVAERQRIGLTRRIAALPADAKNIIVVDGGSYTHRSVDGDALKAQLKSAGYASEVFIVSLPGANHFERASLLATAVEQLAAIPNREERRFVYLRELHSGYDLNPTAQIRDLNDRLIGYATLPTAWRVTRATYRLQSERDDMESARDPLVLLWRASLLNTFGVGRLRSPKTPQRLRDYPGFRPMENNSEVPLTKIDDAINAATALLQPEGATKYLATLKLPLTSDHRAWLDADVAPELHLQMASMFQAQRQFLPFTTQIRDLIYFGKQCGQPHISCLAIDDSYVAAMSELRDSRFWIDVNHLSTSGAAVFTRWLSTHLIAEGVLAK